MSVKAQQLHGMRRITARWESTAEEGRSKQRAFVNELRQAWMRVAVQVVRAAPGSKPWALGVTSAVRGEGRTTSSIGLATALARETTGLVVLVDADLRNPTIGGLFGLTDGHGLDDYIENLCTIDAALAPTAIPNLRVMPAKTPAMRSIPALDAPFVLRLRLPALLSVLREQFAYLVFDLPPLLQDANTGGIASELDGVLLITRAGVTKVEQLQESAELIHGAHLIGTVNIAPSPVPRWAQTLLRE